MEDVPINSESPLLNLPLDILNILAGFLPVECLPDLALTSSVCCALARSRQFTHVELYYSIKSRMLMAAIAADWSLPFDRFSNKIPLLGRCVRKLTVSTNPRLLEAEFNLSPPDGRDLPEESVKRLNAAASYFQDYLKSIGALLQDGFPNIESFHWKDRAVIPLALLISISLSPIKELILHDALVDESFDIIEKLNDLGRKPVMRISYLSLNLRSRFRRPRSKQRNEHSRNTKDSILALWAPTLERLDWPCNSLLVQNPSVHPPIS